MKVSTSESGQRLCEFAASMILIIISTSFDHKKAHKETWKIPGTDRANQIDHVLVSKRQATSILDVKSCRGANCDSDHYLIETTMRQKLSNVSIDK